VRQEFGDDPVDVPHRQMQHEQGTGAPERGQVLAFRHRRRLVGHPGEDHGLAHGGDCQLTPERRSCGREGGDPGNYRVVDTALVEAPHLLGDGTEDRGVTGVQPCDIHACSVRIDQLGDDLVEVEVGGIDQARPGRARGE